MKFKLNIQKEKAIAIDNMLFDLYDLTKAERDAIGFIEIK